MRVVMWITVDHSACGIIQILLATCGRRIRSSRTPIGNYVGTAEAKGFQKLVRADVTRAVGPTLRVELQLPLGQMTQEFTVSGNIAKVETESAAVSDVVTSSQIENLNLNGVNVFSLETLVPGSVQDNSNDTMHLGSAGNGPAISFNGNRLEYSNLEIDGGNNNDEGTSANGGVTTSVLESIAEFRFSTSNYGADVEQHSGAIVEIAAKAVDNHMPRRARYQVFEATDYSRVLRCVVRRSLTFSHQAAFFQQDSALFIFDYCARCGRPSCVDNQRHFRAGADPADMTIKFMAQAESQAPAARDVNAFG